MLLLCKLLPLNYGTGVFSDLLPRPHFDSLCSGSHVLFHSYYHRDIPWGLAALPSPAPPATSQKVPPSSLSSRFWLCLPSCQSLQFCSPACGSSAGHLILSPSDSAYSLLSLGPFLLASQGWVCEHWLHTAPHWDPGKLLNHSELSDNFLLESLDNICKTYNGILSTLTLKMEA